MTQFLPPAMLNLFAPRPAVPFMTTIEKKPAPQIGGLSDFLNRFETVQTLPEPTETPVQRRARKKLEKEEKQKKVIEERLQNWDPKLDPNEVKTSDPFKTLFVARLNYSTSDHKLKREFETYGPIKKVRLIRDKNDKPRGYAFIEFEREKDLKAAYRSADGKKIDGRRILVDMERARISKTWRPRYLGGGLGFTRKGSEEVNQKYSGRDQTSEMEPGSASSGSGGSSSRNSPPPSSSSSGTGGGGSSSRRDKDDRNSRNRDHDRGERDSRRERSDRGSERDRERGGDRDRERGGDRKERYRDRDDKSSRRERERSREKK